MQIVGLKRQLATPPLWQLGFRPCFLAGSLFALMAVPLWLLALTGRLAWRGHEMLFGFGGAIKPPIPKRLMLHP